MTCWKTINLHKDYGFHRITMISFISMLLAFILFYLPMNLIYSSVEPNGDGILHFLVAIVLIYPIHEILHAIPLWLAKKQVKLNIRRMYFFIPIVSARSKHSLSKSLVIIVLVTPFLFITCVTLLGCVLFQSYIHYFTIIAAINFGLSITDFFYLKQFINAPKSCLVEDIEGGYDILVKNN
ncbi:DUF3267 domain-containing protein [Fredinandcohnia quinoae]|uniref:DUF3267 domain-containing protein n=1 Tax=Fredinandcohnia quinoae TaxID=2918902 RepID=A0AAW5EBH6_9BACI|nr:DUF3267 domain-containing protein [Fredinandcohnia sp. SECRCQ15]MCH1626801.1 DUF3267 domain-containing protein [Fredinandcohnia sp. SECRCQ15]